MVADPAWTVETVSHRELRNNSAEVLRRVAAGVIVEVTNHGEVVAVLTPPTMSAIDRLRVSGRTRRPLKSWVEPWSRARARSEVPVAAIIDDLRGGR